MLKYRIMKGRNLKEDNMIKNSSRVDFSLPETNGLSRSLRSLAMTKPAFTLAEVLITLGIIGIVAAMTLPALITKYEKKVATVRLKKFYSSFSQAVMQSKNEYSTLDDTSILTNAKDPDQMLEWYEKYYAPYFKTIKVEKTQVGIDAEFADGSGMLISKSGTPTGTVNTHVLFCVNIGWCKKKNYQNRLDLYDLGDRKHAFLFYTASVPSEIYKIDPDTGKYTSASQYSREDALKACKIISRNCTRLLLMDNWEIKDDYPW
ncbi:type II secretion system protein [bacterium]|nr:type II secretion system protein [bacterium]